MECIYMYLKPYLRIQDKNLLFFGEHVEDLLNNFKEDEKGKQNRSQELRSQRLHLYRNSKQIDDDTNETQAIRKKRNYEDVLFDEVVQLKQLNQAKNTNKGQNLIEGVYDKKTK